MSFDTKEKLNIAISINDGFVMPATVMLNSLFRKTRCRIKLFLLYNSLSDANRQKIKTLTESYGNEFEELLIDEALFKNASLNSNPMYSIEIYYRIMLPYITDVDRILWLDADIIVNGEIAELYYADISDKYIAAVRDAADEIGKRDEIKAKLGIEGREYFNSGVILFNNELIRNNVSQESFFEAIEKFNDDLICPDQDILNYVLGDNCLFVPTKFNYQHHCDEGCYADGNLIIHYIWKKPWNTDYAGHLDKIFWDEAVLCGYSKEYKQYMSKRKLDFYKNELIPNAINKVFKRK